MLLWLSQSVLHVVEEALVVRLGQVLVHHGAGGVHDVLVRQVISPPPIPGPQRPC